MNKIVLDLDELESIVREGGKPIFTQKVQNAILRLMEIKKLIDQYENSLKEKIIASGVATDADFKGAVGDRVNAFYGFVGGRYKLKDKAIKPTSLMKTITFKKLDQEKVEAFVAEHGRLPEEVEENTKTLSFRTTELGKEELAGGQARLE